MITIDMLQIIITTILIYSLILTIVTIYKDNSSYYIVDIIDIIVAGPVCWILCLLFYLIKPIIKPIVEKHKNTPYKVKSKKYIEHITNKVIKNYKKYSNYDELFDFSFRQGEFNCNDIEGWGRLLVNKPINERLNHKFESLMYHQKDDTLVELLKYFDVVTREMLEAGDYNPYFIDDTMCRKYPTYKLKAIIHN